MATSPLSNSVLSLQVQSLMYVVGHIDELPVTSLSLLPSRIRRQLLLSLPAVDICKLEETPVIDGIPMNEIWEELVDRRLPSEFKPFRQNNDSLPYPKENYFESIFALAQCLCSIYYARFYRKKEHLLWAALYAFNYDKQFVNYPIKYQYQGVSKCCKGRHQQEMEFLLTRYSYLRFFQSFLIAELTGIIKLFVDVCHVSFKQFPCWRHLPSGYEMVIRDDIFSNACFEQGFLPYLKKLLSTITIIDFTKLHQLHKSKVHHIMDAVFTNNNCHVEVVIVSDLKQVLPYLVNYPHHCLIKELNVTTGAVDYDDIQHLLSCQTELEKLEIAQLKSLPKEWSTLSFCHSPKFTELHLLHSKEVSSLFISSVVHWFFASPYPATLNLNNVIVTLDRVPEHTQPPHSTHLLSKTLLIDNVHNFPMYILPQFLHLKKLHMDFNYWESLPIQLCSIKTESIALKFSVSTSNIKQLCTLFEITSAKEWEIDVYFEETTSNVLTKFATTLRSIRGIVTCLKVRTKSISVHFGIIENAILSLYSSLPHMALHLRGCAYNDQRLKEFYHKWQLNRRVKFKELYMYDSLGLKEEFEYFETVKNRFSDKIAADSLIVDMFIAGKLCV